MIGRDRLTLPTALAAGFRVNRSDVPQAVFTGPEPERAARYRYMFWRVIYAIAVTSLNDDRSTDCR